MASSSSSGSSKRLAVVVVVMLLFLASSAHARKLLGGTGSRVHSSLEAAMVFSALPRGPVPPSSPINGGNSVVVGERLSAGRATPIDRMLGSVPSPGVGH